MKAVGRADAKFMFVMVSEPTEGMEAWFWRQLHKAGIKKTECRIVYMIDEPPGGSGNKALKSQLDSARKRFEQDVERSTPEVVIPMGTEPFFALTGINESILDARGYLIRKHFFRPSPHRVWKQVGTYKNASKATGAKKGAPKMKYVTEEGPPLLGDFEGIVIPAFTLDFVRKSKFAAAPAFIEDIKRCRRAADGDLREVGKNFKYIATLDALPKPEALGPVIAIDIETHGVDNEVIDLVSFCDGTTTAAIDWNEDARRYIEQVFALPGRLFVCHNVPFDIPRLVANGVHISKEVLERAIYCTMFGGVQIQPDLHKALGRMAPLYLDIEPWKTASKSAHSHWRALVNSDPRAYAAKDSFNTYWMSVPQIEIMKELGGWRYFMGTDGHPGPGVMATLPELAEMTRGGIRTNKEFASALCPKLEKNLFRYMKLWARMFPDVQFSSNPQVIKLLYREWGLPVQYNTEDGVSVDELSLVRLQAYVRDNREDDLIPGAWQTDPRAVPRTFDLMLRMRKLSKMIGTYVQPVMFGEDAWVHPSYLPVSKDDERGGMKMDNKGTTATGRLASYKPNIQNQMKDEVGSKWAKENGKAVTVRHLYVPDTDEMCFIQADYKSAELFVLAGMAGDRLLLADLRSGDMHGRNSKRFGIPRPTVKNVTYASMYLASPGKQSDMILDQEHIYINPAECLATSESIWGYYTATNAYRQLLVDMCEAKRYITNPFGRTRFFHGGRAPAAVDFIPQSTVADILWCVLRDVAVMARSLGGRLVTTVHDSILICVPLKNRLKAARKMKKIMERRFHCVRKNFYIPVEIEWGEPGASWGHLTKTEV